jgi:serine/threonine-protein kinase
MQFPQQFGKYTLLKRLATGGMAEIFLARQAGMGGFEKDVVVKRLLPEHAANQELVSMFLDEARIAANLTHPDIAQIFDLGTQGDSYYIAMELVHGVDLRRLCSQGIAEGNYLPLNHAVRIIAEVCDALAYAHARTDDQGRPLGIVHRDVSPTNILVTFEGGVKLVDFGIAKAANKVSVTRAGQIKGKFGYMSPEQVKGEEIDARSDLFAVGINLYEITLGRRLFRGETDLDTMRSIEECNIQRPREVDPNYPEGLERIVMKALARDRFQRYVTARDMQMALEDFLAEAGLRSTAGMLAEYMRHLFREQLELEAQEAPALRALARSVPPSGGEGAETAAGAVSATVDPEAVISDRDAVVTRMPVVGERPREPTPAPAAPPPLPAMATDGGTPSPSVMAAFDPILTPAAEAAEMDRQAITATVANRFDPAADFEARLRRKRRFLAPALLLVMGGAVLVGVWFLVNTGGTENRIAESLSVNKPAPSSGGAPATQAPAPRPVPKPAALRLSSEPPGARVVVNGNVLDSVTPTTVQTFAGMGSTVRVLLPGYLPVEQRVQVPAEGLDLKVPLQKGAPETAALHVESDPPGAHVAVNGTDVGVTPLQLPRVAAKVGLTLRLTKDGTYPHVVMFQLAPGEDREIGVQLIPDTGPRDLATVNVESIPSGATISEVGVDGKSESLGKTGQFAVKVKGRPIGQPLRLHAEAAGYQPADADLDLRESFYTVYVRLPESEKFYGALSVQGPPGLTVYVGPKEMGKTPLKDVRLPEGDHDVVVFDEKTRDRQEGKVHIDRDKTLVKTVVVAPDGMHLQ